MRRHAWMAAGLLLAAVPPCLAQAQRAESRISAVTVFPDRASVTRVAALRLSKGAHTVEVAPLPSDVEADSVTARGSGEAEVVLSGVRVVTTQLEAAQDPRVKIDHWSRLEPQLKKFHKDYQAIVEGKQGHGFQNPDASVKFYDVLEKFLAKHLRDRKPEVKIGKPEVIDMPAKK